MTSLPSYILSFLVGCMAICSTTVAAQDIPASLPDTTVATATIGETLAIPVIIEESLDGEGVTGIDVHVRYDPETIDVIDIDTSDADVVYDSNWSIVTNLDEPDMVMVSMARGTPAEGGPGVLFWLEVTPLARGASDLEFTTFNVNANAPSTTDGRVVVNDPPEVDNPPDDQTYEEADGSAEFDLEPFFTNPHDDNLSYSASSDNTSVVETAIDENNSLLMLTFVQPGEANITVQAEDEVGSTAEHTFAVTVEESGELGPDVDDPIADVTLTLEASFSLDLETVFSHPDDDLLTFSASSSDEGVVLAHVEGSMLELEPQAAGDAEVTVTAEDEQGRTASDTFSVGVLETPESLSVTVSRSFDDATNAGQYRLVALPGEASLSLSQTLSGSAPDDWRALYDNGQDENYFVEYDGSSTFEFRAGRGFWLISKDAWSVEAEIPPVSPSAGSHELSLHQGWNIISNPFDVDVDWSSVQGASNIEVQSLWAWNDGWSSTSTFSSAMTGEAYYVYAEEAGTLVIPYAVGSTAGTTDGESTEPEGLLRLTATSDWNEQRTSSSIEVGVASSEEEGALRLAAPPAMAERLSLRLVDEDGEGRNAQLARLLKLDAESGASYALTLHAGDAPSRASVDLHLETGDLWPGQEVVLIEKTTGRSFELHLDPRARLEMNGNEPTDLRLLVGPSAYVESERRDLTPEELDILANYPNPFSERTTIEYSLPEASEVDAAVYDLLGRRVRVLAQEQREAGFHELTWDGRDDANQPVASGVYILQMRALGRALTQQMIVVR